MRLEPPMHWRGPCGWRAGAAGGARAAGGALATGGSRAAGVACSLVHSDISIAFFSVGQVKSMNKGLFNDIRNDNGSTDPAQGGVEGSVRLLLSINLACSITCNVMTLAIATYCKKRARLVYATPVSLAGAPH